MRYWVLKGWVWSTQVVSDVRKWKVLFELIEHSRTFASRVSLASDKINDHFLLVSSVNRLLVVLSVIGDVTP